MALNRLVDNNAAQPLTLGTLRVNEGFTSYGQTTLWAGSQSGIGLIVRQALQTQGADIQQWQAADGTVFGRVNSSGEFHHGLVGATARFGTVTPIGTAVLVLSPPAAAYIGLVIRGFAGQTGDIQQWQNSAGTTIGKIDSAGNLVLNATGTGSIQLGDATITKTSGSSFFFNSGGNFSQQVSISSGNLVMKPVAYAGNQSGGITMTDAGGNWTVGGFYLRSDGSGTPRFGFVPPQSPNEILTIVGNQVGINTIAPNSAGSSSTAAQLAITNFTAAGVGLVIRGAASQTGSLQEWQNSSGTVLSSINTAGAFTGSLSRTNTGQVGSIGYTTPGSSSQATWANYPVGFGAMIAASQAANGTPTDNFQYFFKVAVRDVSNGWGGLSIDFSTGDLYVGNANDNTVYASWIKQASTFNANTFNNTQTIIPSAVGNIGLIVRGRSSQTGNLQEWQNNAGGILARVNSGGQLAVPTIANTDGLTAITLPGSRNVQFGTATPSLGGGVVVIGIANATTAPTSNPTGGGILYADSGALKYLGTSGSAATIVNADGTISGGGGASLSAENTWTATQIFTPTNISSSAITLRQTSLASTVNSRFTSAGKGFAATYFSVTANASLVVGTTYYAYFTGVAGFTNGYYSVVYDSLGYFRYDGGAIAGAAGGTITVYQQEKPFKVRNSGDTADIVSIDTAGSAIFSGGGTFGATVAVTGSVTATGTIAATKLNMSSTTLANVQNGGYVSVVNTADYSIAANTWDSFNGSGWATFGGYSKVFLVSGAVTVCTQAVNTLTKVTVKVMIAESAGGSTWTLVPGFSAEITLPAISGAIGIGTIPLNGIITTGANFSAKYFVVEVIGTAAITVKATVQDNSTGNIAGPFGQSYTNNPTANASYVNLIGLK